MRYRKKPLEVEATRYAGQDDVDRIIDWINGNHGRATRGERAILIHTLEGGMIASEGDWVIMGVAGEFYPCRDSIFRATYEEV